MRKLDPGRWVQNKVAAKVAARLDGASGKPAAACDTGADSCEPPRGARQNPAARGKHY